MGFYRTEEEKIDAIRARYRCSEEIAYIIFQHYDIGYEDGKKSGRAEAQRFFRLSLGLEAPTKAERAYWNNPVPLKEKSNDT